MVADSAALVLANHERLKQRMDGWNMEPTEWRSGVSRAGYAALASASYIAAPAPRAAIPPNAVKLCRSHRMNRTIGHAP
jgi:hypothetical protein